MYEVLGNNIMLTITTALYVRMRVLFTMSYINIMLDIIPTLCEGYIVSVHRMVMENRAVDPGSIQRSHRPISIINTSYQKLPFGSGDYLG